MKRILFFVPYAPWTPHTMVEVTLAYALRQRGYSTQFVTCGGLPDCGMAPARLQDHEFKCANCREMSGVLTSRLRHRAEFLQAALTDADRKRIEDWASSLSDEALRDAEFDGSPLGQWTWPDLIG